MNEKNFKSVSEIEKNIRSFKNKICKNQRKIDVLLALNKNLESELKNLRLHKLHFIFEQSQKTFLHSDVDFSLDDFKSFLLSKKSEQKIFANLKKKSAQTNSKSFRHFYRLLDCKGGEFVMKLFIAEKPSRARAIAAALGSAEKNDGYLSVGDNVVTWCFGHILENFQHEDYDKKFAKWNLDDLPIVPIHWKLKNNFFNTEIILIEFFQYNNYNQKKLKNLRKVAL